MITAEQARGLVKTADVNVQRYMDIFDKAITNAASVGEKQVRACDVLDLRADESLNVHVSTRMQVMPEEHAKLQRKLELTLRQFGFSAKMEAVAQPYVPRSREEELDPEMLQHFTFVIRW